MQIGPSDNVRLKFDTPETDSQPDSEPGGNGYKNAFEREKLKAIRKRVSSGYYARKEIIEKLAEKLSDAREVASQCFDPLSGNMLDSTPPAV